MQILKYFKKKNKTQASAPVQGLEFLFECGGKKYYHYADELMIPAFRALSAQDFYEELNCRIDREYLSTYFESIVTLLNKGKLVEAGAITKMAQDRLNHITNVDLLYKLASVLYIEEGEDPTRFSLAFAEQKIENWKKNGGHLDAFFLGKPLAAFIPFSQFSNGSIQEYSKAQMEEIVRMLEFHSQIMSEADANSDTLSSLKQQTGKNKTLLQFINSQ